MKVLNFVVLICVVCLFISCSSKEKKWGKEFDLEGDWWKRNGQFYNPNNRRFMAVGMSRGGYGSLRLERDSADMDARKQVANFMQSMVESYIKECTENGVEASKNMVKAISQEILVGSAIVDRHYNESQKVYFSLVKIDLQYFFDKVKDKVIDSSNKTLMEKYKSIGNDAEGKRQAEEQALVARLVKVEDKVNDHAAATVQ